MRYYKDAAEQVFAFESEQDRQAFGPASLAAMTDAEIKQHFDVSAVARLVPAAVSRFQARAALHQVGRLAEVEAAIAGADTLTQMAWADAQEFRRQSPAILALGEVLGLDLDALFIAAADIQA